MTGARGYTLVETLVVVALFGVVALSAGAVVPGVWREARAAHERAVAFEERWAYLARLEADVHAARSARLVDGWLVLEGEEGAVVHRVEPGAAWRLAAEARRHAVPGITARLRLTSVGGRPAVAYQLGDRPDSLEGEFVVGGLP